MIQSTHPKNTAQKSREKEGNEKMKSTGIVRNIDELGRVVVPKELRRKLGIANTDPVEIYVEEDRIILKKYIPVCHFCGSTLGLREFEDKNICESCIGELLDR